MFAEKTKTKAAPPKKKPAQKPSPPKLSKDKQRIQELLKAQSDFEDKYLRLKAEFENFRRRKEREILRMFEYEGEDIIKALLPIIDDLDRLWEAVDPVSQGESKSKKNTDSIRRGIELIQDKIMAFLKKRDIVAFGAPGEILDADLHDAMLVQTVKGKNENEILKVFEKGYRYRDRVIRHAKVVVNKL